MRRAASRPLLCVWATLCLVSVLVGNAWALKPLAPSLAMVAADIVGEAVVVSDDMEPTASAEEKVKGPVVRCRMCGATIAHKHDHMEFPDVSKAVSSRHAHELSGEIHTFVNPSRMEMELVAFRKAVGIEGEAFTSKATFFEGYSWKDLRCGGCNRHVGWRFHHDDLQECIHTNIMESVSAKAKEKAKSTTDDELAKKRELVRKELEGKCVTANAGWWSYEVCYGKEVRQFHEEQDGSRPSDWSMGVFVASDGSKAEPADGIEGRGAEISQYFAGGQHCDENGELRNTKVVYTCCKTQPTAPTIDNVEEPNLCSYVITVCVPSLCDKSQQPTTPYNNKAIVDKCEAEFLKTHADDVSSPASFAALRWSTVISEDSSELDWARSLDFKT